MKSRLPYTGDGQFGSRSAAHTFAPEYLFPKTIGAARHSREMTFGAVSLRLKLSHRGLSTFRA